MLFPVWLSHVSRACTALSKHGVGVEPPFWPDFWDRGRACARGGGVRSLPHTSAQGQRAAFVAVDINQMSDLIRLEVLDRLKASFGDLYHMANTMLTASHTHTAPGGFSGYLLYDTTSLGFDQVNFDAIVAGIVRSVALAHASMAPQDVSLGTATVAGAQKNRSPQAYDANPPGERAQYHEKFDAVMTGLRIGDNGLLNWLPVCYTAKTGGLSLTVVTPSQKSRTLTSKTG